MMHTTHTPVDYLILGGGSAGCVLAARLSEQSGKSICLVEAGRNLSEGTLPPAIRSRYPGRAYLDLRNIWRDLQASMASPKLRRYEQARVLGGGSAINALMANRGAPADYDEWDALGATGWRWQDCLPYFKKLENDCDFRGELHGASGPLRVSRPAWEQVSPFVQAVIGTLDSTGYPHRPDQNGPWQDGAFVGAMSVSANGERIPTSVCYLSDAVRRRTNLTIMTDHLVDRIIFDGKRATGAVVHDARQAKQVLQARHVIICAGAIHTPAILLRSGVGAAKDLTALGIPVIVDRPAVGRHLMEHPSIAVSAVLPRASRVTNEAEHHEQAIVRFSSGLADTVPGDMHGAILSRSGWHAIGKRLGTIYFWVNKSYSRGSLRLRSTNPNDEPIVDFNLLSDRRDLERLKAAIRFGAKTLRAPSMRRHCTTLFPSTYSSRVAKVAVPGLWNGVQRGILSGLLDIAGPLRAWLIRRFVTQGIALDALLDDEAKLTAFVQQSAGITWHPSGTCRMGREDDTLAATDPQGRVYGVESLRVCDASLMPSIPCANLNVPTIMIAERIADMIKAEGSMATMASAATATATATTVLSVSAAVSPSVLDTSTAIFDQTAPTMPSIDA